MKFIGPIVASLVLVAVLTGCGEPTYPFKGRGYTPGETIYAYTSDDHVFRGSTKRANG